MIVTSDNPPIKQEQDKKSIPRVVVKSLLWIIAFCLSTSMLFVLVLGVVIYLFVTLPVSLNPILSVINQTLLKETEIKLKSGTIEIFQGDMNDFFVVKLKNIEIFCTDEVLVGLLPEWTIRFSYTGQHQRPLLISSTLNTPTLFLQYDQNNTFQIGTQANSLHSLNTRTTTTCNKKTLWNLVSSFSSVSDTPLNSPSPLQDSPLPSPSPSPSTFKPLFSSFQIKDFSISINDHNNNQTEVWLADLTLSFVSETEIPSKADFSFRTPDTTLHGNIEYKAQTSSLNVTLQTLPLRSDLLNLIVPSIEVNDIAVNVLVDLEFSTQKDWTLTQGQISINQITPGLIKLPPNIEPEPIEVNALNINGTFIETESTLDISHIYISLGILDLSTLTVVGSTSVALNLLNFPLSFDQILQKAKWKFQIQPSEQDEFSEFSGRLEERLENQQRTVKTYIKWRPKDFSNLAPALKPLESVTSLVTMEFTFQVDNSYSLIDGTVLITGQGGYLQLPPIIEHPLDITDFQINVILKNFSPLSYFPYSITVPQYIFHLPSSTPEPMRLSGTFGLNLQQSQQFVMQVTVKAQDIPIQQLSNLWPAQVGKGPRKWVLENIQDGILTEGNLEIHGILPLSKDQYHWVDFNQFEQTFFYADFNGAHLTVNYLSGMPLAQDVQGVGTYSEDKLVVHLTTGLIQDQQSKVRQTQGKITIHRPQLNRSPQFEGTFSLEGTVIHTLNILQNLPAAAERLQKLRSYSQLSKGSQTTVLFVGFPLFEGKEARPLTAEDIIIRVQTSLQAVTLEIIPQKINIENATGKIRFGFVENQISGKITALINSFSTTVDFQVTLQEEGIKVLANVDVDIKPSSLNLPFNIAFSGVLKNEIHVQTSTSRPLEIMLYSDLTQTSFDLPLFSYNKPQNSEAELSLTLSITENPIRIQNILLEANDLYLNGHGVFLPDTKTIDSFEVRQFQIKDTSLQGRIDYSNNNLYSISVYGSRIDLYGFKSFFSEPDEPDEKVSTEKQPSLSETTTSSDQDTSPFFQQDLKIIFQCDSVTFGEVGTVLKDVKIRVDYRNQTWHHFQISANHVNDESLLELRFVPHISAYKQHALIFEVQNLGYILNSFQLTDTFLEGHVLVKGIFSQHEDIKFDGHINISDYKIRDFPIFIQLLTIVSSLSVLDLLSTDGLIFYSLDTDIYVKNRCLTISNTFLRGESLRLSIEHGDIDFATKRIEISGYMGLFEFINQVTETIPGTELISSEPGWFAAPFRVYGKYTDPSVWVDPVTLFIPGRVRDIFLGISRLIFGPIRPEFSCQE